VSFVRIGVIAAAMLVLVPCGVQAQDDNAEKKVDSTAKFKEMGGSPVGVFDLPDIVLPTSSDSNAEQKGNATVKATASATTNKDEKVTDLPVPMLNLGIASAGNQKAATSNKYKGPDLPVQSSVDASEFDIAGIFLGMNPKEAIAAALKYDFTLTDTVYNIPNFLKWKYKTVCENEGRYILSEKDECVREIADAKGERYISQITLEKPALKERIKVYFTSNFGNNFAYRIVYDAIGNYSWGTSAEPVFKKRERRKVFWNRLFTKYGWPSDYASMIWTAGFDKASLKVTAKPSTASFRLVLEDISITDADAYRMFKANQKMVPVKLFSF